MGPAEGCDHHVRGMSNIELEISFAFLVGRKPGLATWPFADRNGLRGSTTRPGHERTHQSASGQVTLPIGIEPVLLSPDALGRGRHAAERLDRCLVKISQTETPDPHR